MTVPKRKSVLFNPLSRTLALAALLIGNTTFAEVTFTKVGNPLWEPTGEFMASLRVPQDPNLTHIENQRLFVSDLFGSTHTVQDNLEHGYLPASAHGSFVDFDREFREVVAAAGGIDTNVFLASEVRDPRWLFLGTTFIASEGAPVGPQISIVEQPVIPNEIFPLTFEIASIFRDDIDMLAGSQCVCEVEIPSLSDYGKITDVDGIERDYTGLNWTHIPFPTTYSRGNHWSTNDLVGEYYWLNTIRDANGDGWDMEYEFTVVPRSTRIDGDLNYDSTVDMEDLDILNRNIAIGSTNSRLDLNDDDLNDLSDVHYWVTELKNTWIGDANLDGEFNSGDFVDVFQAGKYEKDELALWSEGDWDADERFGSGDFVVAFQNGGYEMGIKPSVVAVPEPSGLMMLLLGLSVMIRRQRRR